MEIPGELALTRDPIAVAPPWRGRRPPVRHLVEALLARDGDRAANLCDRFLARARTRMAVFADLLQPALYEVGEIWYQGRIKLDDERWAAALVEHLVEQLPPTPSGSPVPRGSRCLLAPLPGDRHLLGLRMFALVLEDEGWEVEVVDVDVDTSNLAALAERVRPRLVGLSAGYLPSPRTAAQVVGAIRGLGIPVLVGGTAFNRSVDLWQRVGAVGHGADARVGAVLARRVVRS
ncbi:MAG TPA: cobalamin B12-binding domain-containing protein [Candidatus Dormibacteraeota bacterium]|nr:cobalamin B12-binding domain-containing protein [Candidatus Dormibacteraeota bacterium]